MTKREIDQEFTAVQGMSYRDMWRWQRERASKQKDLSYQVPQADRHELPFVQSNRKEPTITWIGHCTFLIQLAGRNILIDPVWAQRMGFDKRQARPGLALSDLPDIDIVLISHNHYDHLHYASIAQLKGNPVIFVPDGLAAPFRRRGYKQVEQFKWWDQREVEAIEEDYLRMTFLPSLHWSSRMGWDRNASLWGGWMMEGGGKTIYFVGDSGYHKHFPDWGQRFSIDVALMPIGAYEPEWFMKRQHMNPEEAVKSFLELDAGLMIPMHYGSFRLADDTPREALDRMYAAWEQQVGDTERLQVLTHGQTLRLPQ